LTSETGLFYDFWGEKIVSTKKDSLSSNESYPSVSSCSKLYSAEALEIAMKMHELNPGHADTITNIAILHNKLGNKEKTYEWFEKAAETGGLRSFRRAYLDRYMAMLEHKDRDAFQKPDRIMAALAFNAVIQDSLKSLQSGV